MNKYINFSLICLICALIQAQMSFAQQPPVNVGVLNGKAKTLVNAAYPPETAKPETSPQPKKPLTAEEVYELASDAEVEEVKILATISEDLRATVGASKADTCKYILGIKKFERDNDKIFDVLGIYQRLGKTDDIQDSEIIRWTKGRAGDRIAINKLIGIYNCAPPEEVKEETRNRIIGLLKNLGNLAGYMEAGKKLKTITPVSPKEEICEVFSALKKESDKIEPDLEEFAALYVADGGDAKPDTRAFDFADPQITQRAEKILNFRAKLFLPEKEDIKTNLAKYECK